MSVMALLTSETPHADDGDCRVRVLVIPTDEELSIAGQTLETVAAAGAAKKH